MNAVITHLECDLFLIDFIEFFNRKINTLFLSIEENWHVQWCGKLSINA